MLNENEDAASKTVDARVLTDTQTDRHIHTQLDRHRHGQTHRHRHTHTHTSLKLSTVVTLSGAKYPSV